MERRNPQSTYTDHTLPSDYTDQCSQMLRAPVTNISLLGWTVTHRRNSWDTAESYTWFLSPVPVPLRKMRERQENPQKSSDQPACVDSPVSNKLEVRSDTGLLSNFHIWKGKLGVILDRYTQLCFSLNLIPKPPCLQYQIMAPASEKHWLSDPGRISFLFGERNRDIWGHVDIPAKERALGGFGLLIIPSTHITGLRKEGPTFCCLPCVAASAFCSLRSK